MGNVPPSALRQPPPPGRCLLMIDSNKLHAPTTCKSEGDISRVRSQPFHSQMMCRKANSSNIESLSDELLMKILMSLSADDIYDNARLVCRRWHHLIHTKAFVGAHLCHTSSGLLLKPLMENSSPIFVTAATQGQVKISELSCRIDFPILCSCHGLALCLKHGKSTWPTPFIFNPATKCAFNLPMFPVEKPIYTLGMAYVAASMAYKVVGSYGKSKITHCVILTIGVDKTWRDVCVEGLSPEARWLLLGHSTPLVTGCFLHWFSKTRVVSLNVETEIFTETPTPALMFPPVYQESKHGYHCLSTGKYLSLLISCGDLSWDVWEMKPETLEWRMVLPSIDLEAHKRKIQQVGSSFLKPNLKPVGWVRYPKVLAFLFNVTGRSCVVYNLDTKEIYSIKLPYAAKHHCVVQHRSSLIWSEVFR